MAKMDLPRFHQDVVPGKDRRIESLPDVINPTRVKKIANAYEKL
jgi:hypothetical protein